MGKPIAQIDMDATLTDFNGEMIRRLNKIRSPSEADVDDTYLEVAAKNLWMNERMIMVMQDNYFWSNLPKHQLGFDILDFLLRDDWDVRILTKGPRYNPEAWARKVDWCRVNLPEGISITITGDKSQVYGRLLVDDYVSNVMAWLEHRPRGYAIIPAFKNNVGWNHPRGIRYDGSNWSEVKELITKAKVKNI